LNSEWRKQLYVFLMINLN